MIERIEKAIREMVQKVRECDRDSSDALRWSQAVLNLCNARASLLPADKSRQDFPNTNGETEK